MKLRAILTLETEVENLREAAKWEETVEKLAVELTNRGFEGVLYEVKERRDRAPKDDDVPRYRRVSIT